MKTARAVLSLVVAVCLLRVSTAVAAEKMYVFPVEARKVSAEDRGRVSDMVTKRIAAYRAIDIVTESSVRQILEASKTDMALRSDCMGDATCARDLSKLINSRYFLKVNVVGLRETGLIATAEIVDAAAGRILAKEDWEMATPVTSSDAALNDAIDRLIAPMGLKGELQITPENFASSLSIDGKVVALRGEGVTRYSLLVGSHTLRLTHPDYVPIEDRLFITAGVQAWQPDQITLAEARIPLYKRWWFWALIGAAAAGGATAAYLLSRPEPLVEDPVPEPQVSTIELSF